MCAGSGEWAQDQGPAGGTEATTKFGERAFCSAWSVRTSGSMIIYEAQKEDVDGGPVSVLVIGKQEGQPWVIWRRVVLVSDLPEHRRVGRFL